MSRPMFSKVYQIGKSLTRRSESGFVSSFQTALTNILVLMINVLTGIITARLLGPSDKGVQAAIILWPGLLSGLATIGLPTALLYHIRKSTELTTAFLSAALVLGFTTGLVASGIGLVFSPIWLAKYDLSTVHITQIYMMFVPFAVLGSIYSSFVQAKGDFHTVNGLRILQPIVTLTTLFLLAASGTMTAPKAAFAFLCPCVPAFIWLWFRTHELYPLSVVHFKQVYGRLLSYGVRAYSGEILAVGISQLDKIVIVSLLSPTEVGIYAVAFSLARMLVVFQTAVSSVILPRLIGKPVGEIRNLLGQAIRISTVVTICAALVLAVSGPSLIQIFYGEAYASAVTVFRILAADSVLAGVAVLLAQIFYAVGKPELMTVRYTLGLAVTVPGMLILGSQLGIVGIALTILLETIMMITLTLSAFPVILKIPSPNLWAPREDIRYISRLYLSWQQRR